VKRDIDLAVQAIVEAAQARGRQLKAETDQAVARASADQLGPIVAEATAADKQLSNLADLGPLLLKTDDVGLVQVLLNLEAEAQRLLALSPEALTAPSPLLTCVLEPEKAVAAVAASLQSPAVQPPTPPPPPLAFTYVHAGAQALEGGLKVRHGPQGAFAPATCGPAVQPGASWKIRINAMHGNNWLGLGVVGTTGMMDQHSFQWPTAHFWASGVSNPNQVYIGGQNQSGYGGWVGFNAGDVCVFKLGPASLRMRCSRLGAAVFEIPLPAGTWYPHTNLCGANDEVELLPASVEDAAGL
jgi:hypothetical protein